MWCLTIIFSPNGMCVYLRSGPYRQVVTAPLPFTGSFVRSFAQMPKGPTGGRCIGQRAGGVSTAARTCVVRWGAIGGRQEFMGKPCALRFYLML